MLQKERDPDFAQKLSLYNASPEKIDQNINTCMTYG